MDILCPLCREPWDHDCLHDPFEPGTERARKYRSEIYSKALQKALEDVQRERQYRPMTDSEQLRMVNDRANYYANAWTFRKFGCEVFGCTHDEGDQPDPNLQGLYASTPYPEEWVLD
jgi:hypothetical protein